MADFGRTAADYARHRAGFPPAFYNRLETMGVFAGAGPITLDLGTGTGTIARSLARRGFSVTGVDIAGPLLVEAARLARQDALDVRFVEAPAESTGFDDGAFQLITAGQCWHWFDRPTVVAECDRLLAPGGHLVIAHLDWLTFTGNVIDATYEAIAEIGARFPSQLDWGQDGIYPQWPRDVREAGFEGVETFSFDVDLAYRKVDWRGRVRASAAIGGVLPADEVEKFDALLGDRLEPFDDPLAVSHRVWAVVAKRPDK